MLGELLLLGRVERHVLAVAGTLDLLAYNLGLPVDLVAAASAQSPHLGLDLMGAAHPDRAVRLFMLAQEARKLLPARAGAGRQRSLVGELRQANDEIDRILIVDDAAAVLDLELAALRRFRRGRGIGPLAPHMRTTLEHRDIDARGAVARYFVVDILGGESGRRQRLL